MSGKLWTDADVGYLKAHIGDGVKPVAKALGRTEDAVLQKAYAIGLRGLSAGKARKKYINEYKRQKYWESRDQGLCGHCGKRWAEAGKSKCRVCRLAAEKSMRRPGAKDTLVEYKRIQRDERRANNLCVNCGKPLAKNEIGINTKCRRCRRIIGESRNMNRLRMRIHGIKRKW